MHMTGLAPFTRRLGGDLSGGMKQKLGLACTLVRPPPCCCWTSPPPASTAIATRTMGHRLPAGAE